MSLYKGDQLIASGGSGGSGSTWGSDIQGDISTNEEFVSVYSRFYGNNRITSFSAPNLTEGCLADAFIACNNLESIYLPSVQVVGISGCGFQSAFSMCTSLNDVYLPNLTTIDSRGTSILYDCSGMFNRCSSLSSISFPSLTTIKGKSSCSNMLKGCTSLSTVEFPNLTIIGEPDDEEVCSGMFNGCTSLTTISFPSLTTINGTNTFYSMFTDCTFLSSVYFDSLSITGTSILYRAFSGCQNLTHIYFPCIKGTTHRDSFTDMMYKTGSIATHTIHFPSNFASEAANLSGYPNFGGTTGKVVLAFDLPEA